MARLASETNMGFYATSVKTVSMIMDKVFTVKPNTYVIDPCCGEAEVLKYYEDTFDAYVCGIELNNNRAQVAYDKHLTHLICGDAINGVAVSSAFSGLLFLNPPYDVASDGERLEHKFIEKYSNVPVNSGYMLLVVNPSSVNEKLAELLINKGYAPKATLYDANNDDYKKFGQFFIVLQRVRYNYRHDFGQMMNALTKAKPIESTEMVVKLEIPLGKRPVTFKEFTIPFWKQNKMLNSSKVKTDFFKSLQTSNSGVNSIEVPNDGQAAQLIASGVLNKELQLANGEKVILKGSTKKIIKEVAMANDENTIDKVQMSEVYTTEVFALNLSLKCFTMYS